MEGSLESYTQHFYVYFSATLQMPVKASLDGF